MAEDEEKWIPPVARDWEDAETNEQYWWNRTYCKMQDYEEEYYCYEKALSFRDSCQNHLDTKEKQEYKLEIISKHYSMVSLRGMNLVCINLSGADLFDADLEGANLWSADLREANLSDANLKNADLGWADLRRASLSTEVFPGGAYAEEHVIGGDFSGTDLKEADLRRADFRRADLRGANLKWADLRGADLWHADLRGANLGGATVGDLGYTQSSAPIMSINDDESGAKELILLDTDIEPKGENTILTNIKYNPHSRLFLYPFYIMAWWLTWLWRKIKRSKSPKKPTFASCRQTKFLMIDTTKLVHSDNPRLVRDIRYQQFLADFRDRRPKWFYRPLYYLWGLSSFFGESLLVWLLWATIIVVGFALAFAGHISFLQCDISVNGKPISGFIDALYLSGLVFTSLGLRHFTPQDTLAKMLVLAEVIVGFIMLGSLVSFFANKFVRRD